MVAAPIPRYCLGLTFPVGLVVASYMSKTGCPNLVIMYEGEIVGEFDPKTVTVQELGLYMAGAKRQNQNKEVAGA